MAIPRRIASFRVHVTLIRDQAMGVPCVRLSRNATVEWVRYLRELALGGSAWNAAPPQAQHETSLMERLARCATGMIILASITPEHDSNESY